MQILGIQLWQGNIAGQVTYATFTRARRSWEAAQADLKNTKAKHPTKPKKWESDQKKVNKAWGEVVEIGRKLNQKGKLPPADAILIGEAPSPAYVPDSSSGGPSGGALDPVATVDQELASSGPNPLVVGAVGLVGVAALILLLKPKKS